MPKGFYSTHLYLKKSTYCFRWTFPERLVNLIGKRELRRSMQTGNLRLATRRAVILAARLHAFHAHVEQEAIMQQITQSQIQILLERYVHQAMAEMEGWRCTSGPFPDSEIDGELTALDYLRRDTREQLRRHDHARVASTAEQLAAEAGFIVLSGTPEHAHLCRGMLRADANILDTEIKRTHGDYSGEFTFAPSKAFGAPTPLVPLSQVIAEFKEEHLRSNRWDRKTQTDNAAILRDLMEIVGKVPVATIDKEMLRPYRQTVMALPKEKKDSEARAPFTSEELQCIFLSEDFKSAKNRGQTRSPYMFWLPVIGLHTGARIEELAGLRLEDVKQEGDVWVLDINVKHRRLKNKSSIRQIAIHPTVLELGFLDYVERRRKQGHAYLFPELGVRQGRKGMTASNYFGRYLDRLGITARDKVFHSFRHNLLNRCKQQGIDLAVAQEIAGHANETMTYGLYGKALRPEAQLPHLTRLDFGVDLTPLKGIWKQLMGGKA
jgi:integrase